MATDDEYRRLISCVTILYAVMKRRVQGVNARTFKTAKETVVTFAARTQPWAVLGTAGDRRWSGRPLHEATRQQEDRGHGDVVGLGGRGSGLRGKHCPSCGQPARAVFCTAAGKRCPGCAGGPRPGQGPPAGRTAGPETPQGPTPEALEALLTDGDS